MIAKHRIGFIAFPDSAFYCIGHQNE